MNFLPPRFGALALSFTVGCLLSSASAQTVPPPAGEPVNPEVPVAQNAPSAGASPVATMDSSMKNEIVHKKDASQRHLAPYGTFYMLAYVAVKTENGVDGFGPGQEVHFVEVHRDTRTLVVSDGHAQVEVPPTKLTNDLDIAEMVRSKDQSNQTRIAAYGQAEQEAYQKYERDAADATAKDLQQRKEAQAEEANAQAQAAQSQTAAAASPTPGTDAAINNNNGYNNGYYGEGGYGYGSPYGVLIVQPPAGSVASPKTPAASSTTQGRAAVPAGGQAAGGHAGAGGRPK